MCSSPNLQTRMKTCWKWKALWQNLSSSIFPTKMLLFNDYGPTATVQWYTTTHKLRPVYIYIMWKKNSDENYRRQKKKNAYGKKLANPIIKFSCQMIHLVSNKKWDYTRQMMTKVADIKYSRATDQMTLWCMGTALYKYVPIFFPYLVTPTRS
jgi:hypothetical protein